MFCVDPRSDYKIIFGGDLAKGVGAVHDHAEGKVTLKNIPGRRNHLRLPLIPASMMKKSRVYTQHATSISPKPSPIVAAMEAGLEERWENVLGADVVEYLGEELVEVAMLSALAEGGKGELEAQEGAPEEG